MTHQQVIDNLTEAETAAMCSRNLPLWGKTIKVDGLTPTEGQLFRSLQRKGLVGPRGGLTMRGSIVAEKLVNARMRTLFGED